VVGLDNIAPKNYIQFEALAKYGYKFVVLCSNKNNFRRFEPKSFFLVSYSCTSVFKRIIVFFRTLFLDRSIRHVEIYCAGRGASIWAIGARLFGYTLIVHERGDIAGWNAFPIYLKLTYWVCVSLSSLVIAREPLLRRFIGLRFPSAKQVTIVNGVVPARKSRFTYRDIDFLWANRNTTDRNLSWLITIASTAEFSHLKVVVLTDTLGTIRDIPKNVEIVSWTDPDEYMCRARFFVLFGERVFGNFAVLEAMARGCVPIVSEAPDIRFLIDDEINGIVAGNSLEEVRDKMLKVSKWSDSHFERVSSQSTLRIETGFTIDQWAKAVVDQIYDVH